MFLYIFEFFVINMNNKEEIGKVKTSIKIKRAVWNVVCAIFFRPFITKVFRLWRIFLLKCFGADIDWGAEVYASAKVWAPWNLKMKKGACLGPDTICYNQAMVTLEENVCVSQYAYICTAGHFVVSGSMFQVSDSPLNNAESGLVVAPVTFHKNTWIGTRAYINMGVEVGEGAIVGACACVFKDVEARTIVGGNPAVFIKYTKE